MDTLEILRDDYGTGFYKNGKPVYYYQDGDDEPPNNNELIEFIFKKLDEALEEMSEEGYNDQCQILDDYLSELKKNKYISNILDK